MKSLNREIFAKLYTENRNLLRQYEDKRVSSEWEYYSKFIGKYFKFYDKREGKKVLIKILEFLMVVDEHTGITALESIKWYLDCGNKPIPNFKVSGFIIQNSKLFYLKSNMNIYEIINSYDIEEITELEFNELTSKIKLETQKYEEFLNSI